MERVGRGLAPQVVDDDVHVPGGVPKLLGDVGAAVEEHGTGGAKGRERGQLARVPAGRDDLPGAEEPRDLHRQLTGVAGRAQDEDILGGLEGHPLTQADPGGHGRVHRGGHRHRVAVVGQHDAAPGIDDGLLGHRAHRRVGKDEVAEPPVRVPADTVDPRHERKLAGAGVVRAVGLGPDARVESRGEDVDDDLVGSARRRGGEVLVARGGAER